MADFNEEMKKFGNPNKYAKPSQKETKFQMKEYEEKIKQRKEVEAQIRDLEAKLVNIYKEEKALKEKILIYDVQIRYVNNYHPFTSLKEAADFRGDLVMYGIKESDVKIVLTNDWDELEYIDMHKDPDCADYYNVEKVFKDYRQSKKTANSHWLDKNQQ
jgi:hypothetical protein